VRKVAGAVVGIAVLVAAVTLLRQQPAGEPGAVESASTSLEDRERLQRFWDTYREATALRIAGRPQEAAAAYRQALALNPDHQDALYYLGSMDFDGGDLAAAEQAWRRLVAVDPTNARGHSQLGLLYSCVGAPAFVQLDRAAVEFERALAINREETGPLLHLGEIALLRGDLEQARSYFDAVVGSNYTSVTAYVYKAYLAWKAGIPDQAATLLATAARHARDAAPAAVPGEGDTRRGRAPMVTASATCRPTRVGMAGLARSEAEVARGADSLYRALDSLLDTGRRALPPSSWRQPVQ
jgi:tetratricopeptide (TPR) repeat protein